MGRFRKTVNKFLRFLIVQAHRIFRSLAQCGALPSQIQPDLQGRRQ